MSKLPKCEKCQGLGCVGQPPNFSKCSECKGTGFVGGEPDPRDAGKGDALEIVQYRPDRPGPEVAS